MTAGNACHEKGRNIPRRDASGQCKMLAGASPVIIEILAMRLIYFAVKSLFLRVQKGV
jgi:hypothetical protein